MPVAHEDKTMEEKQELLIEAIRECFKADEHFVMAISSMDSDPNLTCQAFGGATAHLIGSGIVSFINDQPHIKQVVLNELTKMMMSDMFKDMEGEEEEAKEEVAAIPEPVSTEKH